MSVRSVLTCRFVHPSENWRLYGINNPIMLCCRLLRLNVTYQACTFGVSTLVLHIFTSQVQFNKSSKINANHCMEKWGK